MSGLREGMRLDPLHAPLDGLNLIEANAGTGKTWTITALHLRLLLESEHTVDSILVVTFTEIATAELRDRIRQRLAEALVAFQSGAGGAQDVFLSGLIERVPDREKAILRLTGALRDFDQAPIYTIHAFCQRVLGDRAFESLMPFESEMLPDESLLQQQIADDFWRRTLYDASALFVRFVLDAGLTPETLREELDGRMGKPYLEVRKPAPGADVAALEQTYERAYGDARSVWHGARSGIEAQLVNNPSLNGGSYRPDRVRSWLDAMARCLSSERPGLALFKQFPKFTTVALEDGTKKGGTTPSHPFYEACTALMSAHGELESAYRRRLSLLRADLLAYCNEELRARKRKLRLQSYDDLLLDLAGALRGPRGGELTAALRERYKAALIDEFQDTDPVQYRIFQTIYRGSGLPAFLVGDPKQSIYSFRGADVYAYLSARRDAAHRHTLDVNWRSQPALLAAVNRLFEGKAAPFVTTEIPFSASAPAPGTRGHCTVDGEDDAPFEFWVVASEDGKPLSKEAATRLAAQASAAEIARLLNLGARGRARISTPEQAGVRERPLRGGDVAVLVRTHRQAQAVRDALRRLAVASVDRGGTSVFSSMEADELQRVLIAVAEPGREALIRAALVTQMMGCSGSEVHALSNDEARWAQTVESFRWAHGEWRDKGFMRMARAFFQRAKVLERLLRYGDGERRITNLLHLVELLHRESARSGMGATLEWFAEKRRTPGKNNEEELLRLESDENLVKILTVYAAKGLEFPLVFCPFMWDGGLYATHSAAITFHDPAQSHAPVLDLGSDELESCRELAQREELAEDVRLLYVALTRARFRCWMVWGNVRDAGTSAPAWLLHGGANARSAIDVPLNTEAMRRDLAQIEADSGGNIRVRPLRVAEAVPFAAPQPDPASLEARRFAGAIGDTWRVTSFSALAHARAVETPDYDGAVHHPEAEAGSQAQDIHAFPRGARAGRCLHAIFEQVDFAGYVRAVAERVVARELAGHDFAAQWTPVVTDMVERVIATPLDETGDLRLDRVGRGQRLDELEFYYPVSRLSDTGLRSLLLDWGFPDEIRERIGGLSFAPAHGYMKGYIDVVFQVDGRFYLADYKSNWLGPDREGYRQSELRKAMAREAYYLQYLVYCVALHRYLGGRVPGYDYGRHFGGVHYLFLRGMHPESGRAYGVYSDRPDAGLISALDRYLGELQ